MAQSDAIYLKLATIVGRHTVAENRETFSNPKKILLTFLEEVNLIEHFINALLKDLKRIPF